MNLKIVLKEKNTVKEAVKCMEENAVRGVCIVDDGMILKGIFTEGDLRRFILKNGSMDELMANAMNKAPKVFKSIQETNAQSIICPVVDDENRLVEIVNGSKVAEIKKENCLEDVPLVIMAGGLGTRLYPLTRIIPKALIPIGEYTIAERIINNFAAWGCKEVYFIVNYKGDMIRAYFSEKDHEYKVHFVQEKEFAGTGGGLALLKGKINKTFILSNCDILVDADYDCLMKTHKMNGNKITFVGAYKNTKIPYGVIHTSEDGKIVGLQEKPELSFLTNTGVYVIEPAVLEDMPSNKFFHITDFAMEYKDKGETVGVFPITEESWMDMGQLDEMKAMINDLERKEH